MKEKTLLEAATDMLLNRTESSLNEYENSSIEKTIRKIMDLFDQFDEYVMKKGSRLERVLGSRTSSEYKTEIKQLKEHLLAARDQLDQLKEHLFAAEQLFLHGIAQALDMPDMPDDDLSEESLEEGTNIKAIKAKLKDLNLLTLNAILDSATDAIFAVYVKDERDNDIQTYWSHFFRDIETLNRLINNESRGEKIEKGKVPDWRRLDGDAAMELTAAVLEEISERESVKSSITKKALSILNTSYTDFNSIVFNFSEDSKKNLEEGTEVDDIATKVKELKVGDKTNFGQVVAISSNSVTFKSKDLPKTKITFNQRKMGSRDYVLSALRKIEK